MKTQMKKMYLHTNQTKTPLQNPKKTQTLFLKKPENSGTKKNFRGNAGI
jgi:hypothetical protein